MIFTLLAASRGKKWRPKPFQQIKSKNKAIIWESFGIKLVFYTTKTIIRLSVGE